MAGSIFILLFISSIYTMVDASFPPNSKYSLQRNHQKNMDDPKTHVFETKSDSMQLYSVSARRMVIVQEKKGSTSMTWDNKEYELRVMSNKRRLNVKKDKFVTETVSYGKLKIRSLDNDRYLCIKKDHKIHFEEVGSISEEIVPDLETENANRKNKPKKRCLFTWEFTKQKHIKLSIEKYGAKWYLTVIDDVVSLKKEIESTELQKSFIWIPAHSTRHNGIGGTSSRKFGSSEDNSSCNSRLGTCKENYNDCFINRYIKKLKIKSLNDRNKMLQLQFEEVQRELLQLKKTEYTKSSPES